MSFDLADVAIININTGAKRSLAALAIQRNYSIASWRIENEAETNDLANKIFERKLLSRTQSAALSIQSTIFG